LPLSGRVRKRGKGLAEVKEEGKGLEGGEGKGGERGTHPNNNLPLHLVLVINRKTPS